MATCLIFVFSSLLEYATVNFLSRQTKVGKGKRKKERERRKSSEKLEEEKRKRCVKSHHRRPHRMYNIEEIDIEERDCSRGYNEGCDAPGLGGVQAFNRRGRNSGIGLRSNFKRPFRSTRESQATIVELKKS